MSQFFKRSLLIITLSIAIFCVGITNVASAETAKQPDGLTVSPLRTELEIAPGTSQEKTLSLTNGNDYPIKVNLSAEEFSVISEQYDYAFNVETQLVKWVTFTPGTLELAVGETKTATFRVGVPVNAEPGGRYISMFASTDTDSSNDGVISRQRVASLLYINVAGEVTRSGNLISLSTPWLMTGLTPWSAQVQNTGTTHFRTRYSVTLKSLIGDNTIATKNGDNLILPSSIRALNNSLPLPALPGIYKVVYTIGLGDTPAVIDTRIVVYLPPVTIIVSLFAIILILSLINEYRSRTRLRTEP